MKAKRIKYFLNVQILRILALLFPLRRVRSQKQREIFTKIWHAVWLEQNYTSPEERIVEKYSKYDKFSVDFILKFFGAIPIGTFRFIHGNDEVGLPVLKDFEIEKQWENDNNIIEATLLTVKKEYRSFLLNLASLVLMRGLARYCKKNHLEGPVMACDKRLFFVMRRKLGFPIQQIGPEKFYEGSLTYPAFINTKEFYQVMGKTNPFFTS